MVVAFKSRGGVGWHALGSLPLRGVASVLLPLIIALAVVTLRMPALAASPPLQSLPTPAGAACRDGSVKSSSCDDLEDDRKDRGDTGMSGLERERHDR